MCECADRAVKNAKCSPSQGQACPIRFMRLDRSEITLHTGFDRAYGLVQLGEMSVLDARTHSFGDCGSGSASRPTRFLKLLFCHLELSGKRHFDSGNELDEKKRRLLLYKGKK